MCFYPKLVLNKKYTANKKNGGIIPPIFDERVKHVAVGCGKCKECRKQKARNWQVRMLEDVRHNRNGKMVTLTFSDKSIAELAKEIRGLNGYNLDNEIATLAVRRFLERWRKKYKKSLRHWFVTELGHNGTENIHMHGIVWTDEPIEEVEKHWKYGFVWKGKKTSSGYDNYVNEKTVNYLTKYVNKLDFKNREYESKILTSAGIGRDYTGRKDAERNKYNGVETLEAYKTRTGHNIAMPSYWRNKIYSDEEREKLWLNLLDKNIRWVDGVKVDISNGEEEYYKVLIVARSKNKRLGYGDDSKNWERKRYENERRRMLQKVRIAKGLR